MKYSVLLVKPINNKPYQLTPDFGIGYVASALIREGHSVVILDCPKKKMDHQAFGRYVKDRRFDVVGFKIFSSDVLEAKRQIETVRDISPDSIVVVGGPHPSGLPVKTFEYLKPNYLFIGEAEIGFTALLKEDFNRPDASPGLVWKDGEKIRVNDALFAQDIDRFGIPAWDLLDPGSYPDEVFGLFVKRFPSMPVITSRGCPFPCTFCAGRVITGGKIRRRSVDLVIDEIKLLRDKYGVRDIQIVDDNFTFSKTYVKDFCNTIIVQDMGISWSCPNGIRLDTLDGEVLKLMEKAGCYSIAVGIESGSPKVLSAMQKHLTLEKIRDGVALIKKNTKIKVTGFFLLGYPIEARDDALKTIRLATDLTIDRAAFSLFSPLPGSPVYYTLVEAGKIKEDELDWSKLSIDEPVIATDGITIGELKMLQKEAVSRFYMRPKILFSLLKEIRSLGQIRIILKRLINVIRA